MAPSPPDFEKEVGADARNAGISTLISGFGLAGSVVCIAMVGRLLLSIEDILLRDGQAMMRSASGLLPRACRAWFGLSLFPPINEAAILGPTHLEGHASLAGGVLAFAPYLKRNELRWT